MAVRLRKYFQQCKPIPCNGRQGKYCPGDRPKRSNGEYKDCSAWAIEYRELDGRWVSKIFPGIGKTQATELYEEIRSNIRRKMVGLPTIVRKPTFTEYASKTYLELCKNNKKNTFLLKKSGVNSLVKYLGTYSLDKITPFIIEKYRIDRKESDKVKDSSLNTEIAVLSHIFTTATKAGIVAKNPCQEIKRLKVTHSKDRILSGSEIALLLDRLQGKDRLVVLMGLFTGLRLGGILGLSWQDIDFRKGLITSSHKTGKAVSIPLSDYLAEELLRHKDSNPGDRVFDSREITNAVVAEYSKRYSKLFKDMGIQNFTFHGLRHTFSSLLQGELGVGAVVVQGMTGHSSLAMLQRYSHTGLDNKRRAIEALTGHVLSKKPDACFAIAQ
ncbi:MAG: tyrosine-type recombinase/integrase [Candidatus Brocadia sinica]|nr:tyrosine-type recombinase/integrase [Candidatus Brocadia sinica]